MPELIQIRARRTPLGNRQKSGIFVARMKYYLREWRKKKAMTQEELGFKSGVDPSTIIRIERDPSRETLGSTIRALAGAMDLEPEDLSRPPYDKPSEGRAQAAPKPLPELEDRLKGRITIDGIELTAEEKEKLLAMAKILRGR